MSGSTTDNLDGATQTVSGGTGDMFDEIAGRYDLLNRILSLGQDPYWRRRAVKALKIKPGDRIIDVATGTGDLAMTIAKTHTLATVQGIDPSANMIGVGNDKITRDELTRRVQLDLGDGQALDFEDDAFDGAIVSFGIRNFPDRFKGLQEMARVTRKGRQVVILELSEPKKGPMAVAARTYIHHVVPRIGSVLSGKKEYRYLQESIAAFPSAEQFTTLMQEAGLERVKVTPLSFGAVNLFVGTVA